MKRKLFALFFALAASIGLSWGATVVTFTLDDLPSSGRVLTKDGVTLIAGELDTEYGNIYQGGTFTTNLGNFVSIEVQAYELTIEAIDGWTGDSKNMTWTGSASEVTFYGDVMATFGHFTITCTIGEAAPEYLKVGDTIPARTNFYLGPDTVWFKVDNMQDACLYGKGKIYFYAGGEEDKVLGFRIPESLEGPENPENNFLHLVYKTGEDQFAPELTTRVCATATPTKMIVASGAGTKVSPFIITHDFKADPDTVPMTKKPAAIEGLTYTGQPQALITRGEIEYPYYIEYKCGLNEGFDLGIPWATDPGTYTVYYRIQASNFCQVGIYDSLQVTIGHPTVTLAENVSIVDLPIDGITDKGNGVYEVVKGTVFSVQVAEPEHYTFDHWGDLSPADSLYTANPREITMTGNMNLTPVYNIDTYSLTLGVNDPARGSVKIAPPTQKVVWSKEHLQTIYEWKYNNPRAVAWEAHENNEKDGISINATPNASEVGLMSDSYYDFKPLMFFYDVNASITFNSNIYTFNSIEIYGEHTANFNGWTYNTAKGCYQVSGLGNTVSLTPTEGAEIYQFVDSIIFYANSALPQGVTPTETPGVYTVEWGSEISFVATPASEDYNLAKWNDEPAASDTLAVTVVSDTTITATFAHVPYIITLPEGLSIVGLPIDGIEDKGNGVYAVVEGTQFQVSVDSMPEHHHFAGWADLDAEDAQYMANPRTLTADSTMTLEPIFAIDTYTLTLATNDSTKGVVKVLGATPTVMEGVKQVGSGNETAPIPIVQPNWYSVSQQLYTSEEIGGKPGTIESIAYYAIGAQSRYLEIYITATNRSVYNSKSDILPIREGVLVFEGNVNFVADDWTPITFKEPLEYNGKDNLAITVFDESGSSCSLLFRSFTTTGTQAAYLSSTVPHYNYQINNFSFMTKSGNKPIKSQILFNFASAPVSAETVPFDAPASWNGDATYITAADLPGFAPISNDDALALSQTIWVEESGLLIFGFDGEYTYSVLMDGGYREILYQPYTRGYIYSSINNYSTSVFYTTAAATGIIDNGDGTYSVDYGTEINLLAEPAEDHYLVSWNGEPATSDTLKITFTSDQSVTATFAHVPYIYTLPEGLSIVGLPIDGIEDKGNGIYEVADGTEFQVSVDSMPEHYHFTNWADLAETDSMYAANPRTIVADSALTLEPIFAIDTYTLTLATNDSTKGVVKVLGGVAGVRETIILKNKGAEDPIQGEYFQVSGGGTDNFGRYIGRTDGYSLTISSLNGEMIDSISFSVTATSMWSGHTVSSTSGEVVDNVFGNYTFKVKNINATSVTISRIGDGDPSGSITVDVVYVNQDMPIRAEISDMEFPTSGNTLTINDMTLTVGSFDLITPKITGGGTFTTDLGEFTAISIYSYGFDGFAGEGWTGDMYTQRWTGQSSSVSFEGMVFGDGIGSITITYTIVPAPAATGGIVDNGDGTYTVDWGTELTFVAQPAEDHHLVSWNGEPATSDTLRLTMEGELSVSATFAHDPYVYTLPETVSMVEPLPAGVTDKGNGVYEIEPGTEFQVSANIPEHYHIAGWADLDAEDAAYLANPRTLTADSTMTLEPIFAIDTYTLTLATNDSTKGVVSVEGAGVDIVWDANFWNGIQAYMNGEDIVHANNSKDGITITFDGGDFENGLKDGKIKLDNSDNKLIFTSTVGEFTKIFLKGYVPGDAPEGWDRVAGLIWEVTPSATVELPGSAALVEFEEAVFTLTSAASGIVDNGDGTYTVDWGTELTFVAQPAEGFMLESWSNGAEVTGDTLKLTMTEELSLTANFKYIPAVITLPDGVNIVEPVPAGITDNGDGTYTVEHGTEFQVSVDSIPAHYHFDHWADLDAEDEQYAANPRTIVADSALTLEPIFAIDTHTLTLATNDSTKGVVILEGAGQGGEPEGKTIEWDSAFMDGVIAYMSGSGALHSNNTKDGITVTYEGASMGDGMQNGLIHLDSNDKLVFTSTVGDIAKIEIYGTLPNIAPENWTIGEALTWEGTPAAVVELPADVHVTQFVKTVFTLVPAASGIVDNGDGTYTVDWGTELTFIAQPAENYHLDSWWNSGFTETGDTLKITLEGDTTVNAYFKHDTYILSVEGTEIETAKFYDGTDSVVVLNPGTLIGVVEGDSVLLTTTANYSSANIGEDLTITVHYDIKVVSTQDDYEYALAITDSIYPIKGFIIEPLTPDSTADTEDEEAENKEGLEIQAYGYCNGSSYSIKYHLKSGNPDQYKIDFADARFTDVDWTDLTTNGADGTIDVEIPVDLPTGDYSMTVTFRDSRFTWLESEPITVSLHVNLPETYIVALFDNVIAVVDTCECLTDIQWYWRADATQSWTLIEGATGYYYKQEGGLSGEYFIKAKMNGIDTYTCPQDDMSLYGDGQQAKVSAYPNPVLNTTTVTIENSRAWNHTIRIVNLMGNEMMMTTFEGDNTTVEMSSFPQGHYMISVDGVVVKVMKK